MSRNVVVHKSVGLYLGVDRNPANWRSVIVTSTETVSQFSHDGKQFGSGPGEM